MKEVICSLLLVFLTCACPGVISSDSGSSTSTKNVDYGKIKDESTDSNIVSQSDKSTSSVHIEKPSTTDIKIKTPTNNSVGSSESIIHNVSPLNTSLSTEQLVLLSDDKTEVINESDEEGLKQENLIKYCQDFPKNKTIDWTYLNNIDFNKLRPVSTKDYLERTKEEKIFNNGEAYIKIKSTFDGDSIIRNTNFLILENLVRAFSDRKKDTYLERMLALKKKMPYQVSDELIETLKRNSPQKHFDILGEKLKQMWPYRSKSTNDPGLERIMNLFERLSDCSDIDHLLSKLNHPCVDMVLSWLMRDLSWAYYNHQFELGLKALNEKDILVSSIDFENQTDEIINNKNLPSYYIIIHLSKLVKKNYFRREKQSNTLMHKSPLDDFDSRFAIAAIAEELFTNEVLVLKKEEANKPLPKYLTPLSGLMVENNRDIEQHFLQKAIILVEDSPLNFNLLISKSFMSHYLE